jgi:hypothetical protein
MVVSISSGDLHFNPGPFVLGKMKIEPIRTQVNGSVERSALGSILALTRFAPSLRHHHFRSTSTAPLTPFAALSPLQSCLIASSRPSIVRNPQQWQLHDLLPRSRRWQHRLSRRPHLPQRAMRQFRYYTWLLNDLWMF